MTTDSAMQRAVLLELEADPRVRETDVGVAVQNGVVTLTGIVPSWAERRAAQEAAHRVDGVLDVANDIKVRIAGSAGRTDTEIATAVRHALEWDVLVPDTRIRSTVSAGEVTLEGDVDTWAQHEDAERAVAHLTGVRAVHNKIGIRHGEPAAPTTRGTRVARPRAEVPVNAADVMSRHPLTLSPSALVADAARLMREEHVRHVPITSHGRLVGMLSDRDVGALEPVGGDEAARLAQPISALAHTEVVSVHPETELRIVLDLLIDRRIGAVPVVERDGHRLVGLVSTVDVLRAVRDLV